MNQFRIHNRRNRLLMVFMAVMALLFVQTLPLHVHSPHDHRKQLDQVGMLDNHAHPEIHVASSDANIEGEHDLATEIDLSADAVVKNLKFSDTLVAVLFLSVILLVPLLVRAYYWPVNLEVSFTTRGIAFRPPLRAPPL